MATKVVLNIQVYGEKEKRKTLKTVSSLPGIESVTIDMKGKKLTVIGKVDVVEVVRKLRKHWTTEVVTIGPAVKEPQPHPQPLSQPQPQKKKPTVEDNNKKKKNNEVDQTSEFLRHSCYNDCINNPYCRHYHGYIVAEENPNSCVLL